MWPCCGAVVRIMSVCAPGASSASSRVRIGPPDSEPCDRQPRLVRQGQVIYAIGSRVLLIGPISSPVRALAAHHRPGPGQTRTVPVPSWPSVVLFALGWVAGWLLLWRARPLPSGPPRAASVSVIVPARDEAGSLPALLGSVRDRGTPCCTRQPPCTATRAGREARRSASMYRRSRAGGGCPRGATDDPVHMRRRTSSAGVCSRRACRSRSGRAPNRSGRDRRSR